MSKIGLVYSRGLGRLDQGGQLTPLKFGGHKLHAVLMKINISCYMIKLDF